MPNYSDYKNPDRDGYPFPSRQFPVNSQVIDAQTAKLVDQLRKANGPKEPITPLGRQAIMRETERGGVKELNFMQKPKPQKSGNHSSF